MRNLAIAKLQSVRDDDGYSGLEGDYDPLSGNEWIDFPVPMNLNELSDEELVELLFFYGQFEG